VRAAATAASRACRSDARSAGGLHVLAEWTAGHTLAAWRMAVSGLGAWRRDFLSRVVGSLMYWDAGRVRPADWRVGRVEGGLAAAPDHVTPTR